MIKHKRQQRRCGGYYVLMPTGNIYAWDGNLTSTLKTTPVATTTPSVWYNPLLLTNNTGAPIVTSGTNPLYDLSVQFGLTQPAFGFNFHGENEEYFLSNNGSNAANGGYYVLMPNDMLYAWEGSLGADTLVADLTSDGNVYANPALLSSAVLPTAIGVTASISGGDVIVTPATGFDRAVNVIVTIYDGLLATAQSFIYTVNDTAPTMSAEGPITVPHNGTIPSFNLGANGNGSLTYSISVGGDSPIYETKLKYGLNQPAFGFDFNKQHEWYFLSTNGSNSANGGYYVLTSNDMLYAWTGNITSTITAPAVPVFDFTPYGNVYQTPALLSSAFPAIPTVGANQGGLLYSVKEQFGLTTPNFLTNFAKLGLNETYFLSTNGSNAANSGYYVLMPTGLLYAWDGNSLATTLAHTSPVADLSATGAYADPALIYQAVATTITDTIYAVKDQFGLTTPNFGTNFANVGLNETYFLSTNGSNAANGGYYVLMPNNNLYAWDGNSLSTTIMQKPVATFGATNVYANPALLYADSGQVAAVTASVTNTGRGNHHA